MSTTALPPVTVTGEATGGGGMSFLSMLGAQAGGSLISGLFNKSSAKDQMRFQERMANTAYQRAAKDLEAAGLNRIIALGNPAASPSGAMGTMAPIDASAASAADVNRKTAVYQRELLESQANAADQSAATGKAQESLLKIKRLLLALQRKLRRLQLLLLVKTPVSRPSKLIGLKRLVFLLPH